MDYVPKTFKIDREIAAELEMTAEREGRTMTAIVERALRTYFALDKALSPAAPALAPAQQEA